MIAAARQRSGATMIGMAKTARPLLLIVAVVLVSLSLAPAGFAQSADPQDIAAGMRLFRQKANCQVCHGWAGDGRKMDSQMPDGKDLRETGLDRDSVITTIKCGRPGTGMPAFDRFAYSDGRCKGLKAADLKARGLELSDPPATLQPNEVELLADFLLAKVIGKGQMTRAQCAEYWGKPVEACDELPK
jgi:mono/diheme cytochrome c family protein